VQTQVTQPPKRELEQDSLVAQDDQAMPAEPGAGSELDTPMGPEPPLPADVPPVPSVPAKPEEPQYDLEAIRQHIRDQLKNVTMRW